MTCTKCKANFETDATKKMCNAVKPTPTPIIKPVPVPTKNTTTPVVTKPTTPTVVRGSGARPTGSLNATWCKFTNGSDSWDFNPLKRGKDTKVTTKTDYY